MAKRVKYLGGTVAQKQWGNCDSPDRLLVIGQEYEVKRVSVHSWFTCYYLKDFPHKKFNSVLFTNGKKVE